MNKKTTQENAMQTTDAPALPQIQVKKTKKAKAERQNQVLDTLLRLLNEDLARVTTERLAAAVGVSEGALYRYYPSKTQMFEAFLERVETSISNQINHINRRESHTEARIKHIVWMLIEFGQTNPGITRILTGHALMYEEQALRERTSQLFQRIELQLANILQLRKLREGKSFPISESSIATLLINLVIGQLSRFVRQGFGHYSQLEFNKQWQILEPIFA